MNNDLWYACPICFQPLSTKPVQAAECFCSDYPIVPIEMTDERLRKLEKTSHMVQDDRNLQLDETIYNDRLRYYWGE